MLDIGSLPENESILDRVRASAEPATSEHRLGDWELHAHPDLMERLDDVDRAGRRVELFGLPGRASARGVVYAVATGTDRILLRLRPGREQDAVLANGGLPAPEYGPEWVAANAWLTDVPLDAGTALLTAWLDAAREAADA